VLYPSAVARCILRGTGNEGPYLNENAQPGDINKKRMELSEVDKELVVLVALGLTDDEIATQLQIPKHNVLDHIARLLAKLGVQNRVEILFYAYSDPAMYQRITTKVTNRTTKKPQAQTPGVKPKAS
jgi:DNA-binding CsgD family transcriptional regulator